MEIDQLIYNLRGQEAERRSKKLGSWFNPSISEEGLRKISNSFCPVKGGKKLHITYVMNHVRVCGGSKIIFEHTNHLVERGHEVTIVCHFPKPDWIEVKAKYIQVAFQDDITKGIPKNTDIIICTVADQLIECYLSKIAPVVHFEQGDIYIYEFEKCDFATQEYWKKTFSIPVPILAVSQGLANALYKNFRRKAQILHNALDDRFFYPRLINETHAVPRILFVGSEQAEFKGIKDIFSALDIVKEQGLLFEAVWVTPTPPVINFQGTLVVNPPQNELGEIYRSCDIYVSGSYYESFPLPPLEAMSCGCAVISTENVGVVEYGVHETNCLLTKIGDPQSIADEIIELIRNKEKTKQLVVAGYETAAQFKWENIIKNLESYLYSQLENCECMGEQVSLRVATLPKGLSDHDVEVQISNFQNNMEEDWCLWLIEGESVSESEIQRLKFVLSECFQERYFVQVKYDLDVPDHPLLRWEPRLLRRKVINNNSEMKHEEKIPFEIRGGMEGYFLPIWLRRISLLYLEQKFDEMIEVLKQAFSVSGIEEKAVILKWIVLALIENEMFNEALTVIADALQVYPSNSDLLYLRARLEILLGDYTASRYTFKTIQVIGDSSSYVECFADMKQLCSLYTDL